MKLTTEKISSKSLMFAILCFIQATVLRSGYIISVTKQDSWAMPLTGLLLAIPMGIIYAVLLKNFPGKNLIEINDLVFGRVIGKGISALYVFFFASLAALNTRDVGGFVVGYLMPETPIAAINILLLIGCVYVVKKGIQNLMHFSTLMFILILITLSTNSLLVLKDIEPHFLKPMFTLDFQKYLQSTVSVAAVPFGEILVFTMLAPMLGKGEKAGKAFTLGLVFSALITMMIMMRDIVTLGPLVGLVALPTFETIRYVSLAGILTRMESVYAIILILLFLFKVSILLYAFVMALTQLFCKADQNTEHDNAAKQPMAPGSLTLVSAAFVLFYSLFVFESVMENINWGATTAPFFSLTFELLLPAVTLLVFYLRKLGKPPEVKA